MAALQQTRDGYIWMATADGLVRFDGVRFSVFNRGNSPGLANNRFTSLYDAADGAIWAGTEGSGITRCAGGAFTTYTARDGLADDHVRARMGRHGLQHSNSVITAVSATFGCGDALIDVPIDVLFDVLMGTEITVLIADDHPTFRRGLREVIEAEPDLRLLTHVEDGEAAWEFIQRGVPRVAVLDVDMPRKDGLAVARAIKDANLVADYKTSRDIANELFISVRTVDRHRANIVTKLDLRGAHALLQFAIAHKDRIS